MPLPPDFWDRILVSMNQTKGPSQFELSRDAIMHIGPHTDKAELERVSGEGHGNKGPLSTIGWIFDKLSRPLYGMENNLLQNMRDIRKNGVSADNVLSGAMPVFDSDFWRGFTKKDKVSGALIADELGIKNNVLKAITGFGIDVGLDPLTYVPGGAIYKGAKGAFKGAKAAEEGAKIAPEAAAGTKEVFRSVPKGEQLELPFEPMQQQLPLEFGGAAAPAARAPKGQQLGLDFEGAVPDVQAVKNAPLAIESGPVGRQQQKFEQIQQRFSETPTAPIRGVQEMFDMPPVARAMGGAAWRAPVEEVVEKATPQIKGQMVPNWSLKPLRQTTAEVEKKLSISPAKVAEETAAKQPLAEAVAPAKVPKIKSDNFKHDPKTNTWKITSKGLTNVTKRIKARGETPNPESIAAEKKALYAEDIAPQQAVVKAAKEGGPAQKILAVEQSSEELSKRQSKEQLLKDADEGDPAAQAVIDNVREPGKSATGHSQRVGSSVTGRPIRAYDELKPYERADFVDPLVDHIRKEGHLNPKVQSDLYTERLLPHRNGGTVSLSQRIKSTTQMNEYMRIAMQRAADEGIHPSDWVGNHYNLHDIIDDLGGTRALTHLGYSGVHNFSKAATRIIKHFDESIPAGKRPGIEGIPDNVVAAVKNHLVVQATARAQEVGKAAEPFTTRIANAARESKLAGDTPVQTAHVIEQQKAAARTAVKDPDVIRTIENRADDMKQPNTPTGQALKETGSRQYEASANGTRNKAADARNAEAARNGRSAEDVYKENAANYDSPVVRESLWNRFRGAFDPAMGQKTVHENMRKGISSLQQETQAARVYLNQIAARSTLEQRHEAWRELAKGNPENNPLAREFQSIIDNVVGRSGYKKAALEGQSAVLREGLGMEELNKMLWHKGLDSEKFRFSKHVKDELGRDVDLSEGVDWLNSLIHADPKKFGDPIDLLSRVKDASTTALMRKAIIQDISEMAGKTTRQGVYQFRNEFTGPDVWLTKELNNEVGHVLKAMDEFLDPGSKGYRQVQSIMRVYKSYLTLPNPQHHVTNAVGNAFFNYLAGAVNPFHYKKAGKIASYERNQFRNKNPLQMQNFEQNLGEGAFGRAIEHGTEDGSEILINKRGVQLTARQLSIGAREYGIRIGAQQLEDIATPAGRRAISDKLVNNRVMDAFKKMSELNENYFRDAHFIHELEKRVGKMSLDSAMRQSAREVRKWHPDGTDLTQFERKYMRFIFPFYSWTRKAIPLAIESMVAKPGKVVVVPKASLALATAMGLNKDNALTLSDPFPADQAFPDWIRQNPWGPQLPMGLMGATGYGMLSPSLPTFDPLKTITAPFGGKKALTQQASMLNPVFKIPWELGRTTPEDNGVAKDLRSDKVYKDRSEYLSNQMPALSTFMRLTGKDPLGGFQPTRAAQFRTDMLEANTTIDKNAIIRWLSGSGYLDTGQYAGQAEKEWQVRRAKETGING